MEELKRHPFFDGVFGPSLSSLTSAEAAVAAGPPPDGHLELPVQQAAAASHADGSGSDAEPPCAAAPSAAEAAAAAAAASTPAAARRDAPPDDWSRLWTLEAPPFTPPAAAPAEEEALDWELTSLVSAAAAARPVQYSFE